MKKYLLVGLLALTACGPYPLSSGERDTTELGATKFAMAMSEKLISCSGQDSDGDKYVTCTISKTGDPSNKTQAILCSYESQGCKPK